MLAPDEEEVEDDDAALAPDVADESACALLLAGLAAADLLGPFDGSGNDPRAFSRIGITLDFEAGCN